MTVQTKELKTDKEKEKEKLTSLKVAVYGSLRKGLHNHRLLEDSEFLGEFETQPEYTMYSVGGGFPGLVEGGNTSIVMEVYAVDEKTFEKLNNLEGFYEDDSEHNFYNRIIIETPYGLAFLYIYNMDTKSLYLVESGDWVKYKETNSLVNSGTC